MKNNGCDKRQFAIVRNADKFRFLLFELRIYKGSNHRCSQLTDNFHLISSSFKSKMEKEKRGKRMKEKKNI